MKEKIGVNNNKHLTANLFKISFLKRKINKLW